MLIIYSLSFVFNFPIIANQTTNSALGCAKPLQMLLKMLWDSIWMPCKELAFLTKDFTEYTLETSCFHTILSSAFWFRIICEREFYKLKKMCFSYSKNWRFHSKLQTHSPPSQNPHFEMTFFFFWEDITYSQGNFFFRQWSPT